MSELLNKLINVARGQVNTTESPPNSNRTKYGEWYGMDGVPWCAIFVSWLFAKVGLDKEIPKFAYTPSFAEHFRAAGQGFTTDGKAKRGDVVFFNFPDSLDRIQHVGIVLDLEASALVTIEGNTSAGASGSQDNGGGVYIRRRGFSEAVYYGRPAYNGELEESEKRFKFPVKAFFGRGDKGADIRTWQHELNRFSRFLEQNRDEATDFGPFKLEVDGGFGIETEKATKTFQHWYNQRDAKAKLDVDGKVGKATLAAMDKVRDRQKEAASKDG